MEYASSYNSYFNLGSQTAPSTDPFVDPSVTGVTDKDGKQAAKEAKAQQRVEEKAAKAAQKALDKAAKAVDRKAAKEAKAAEKAAWKAAKAAAEVAAHHAASSALSVGDQLAIDAENFSKFEVQSEENKNSKLYQLLTDIHAFVEHVQAQPNVNDIIKAMRHKLSNSFDIKTQANSPALNVIVRYVTRTNRKNACVYARVLSVAQSNNISSADLTDYIRANNGIHNIRKSIEKKPVDPVNVKKQQSFWDYAQSYLEAKVAKPMATFKLGHEHNAYMCDTARGGKFSYFVCDYADGEYKVVDVLLMDKALEQQLLERVYSNIMDQTILTQEDVDLRNAIEAKLGMKRKIPLVANAYVGN